VLDFEEEQFRLGNFEKIFPCINNVVYYSQFFEYPRGSNQLLSKYLGMIAPKQNQHHICFAPASPVVAPSMSIKERSSTKTRRKQKERHDNVNDHVEE
jgi:hypothetical protein